MTRVFGIWAAPAMLIPLIVGTNILTTPLSHGSFTLVDLQLLVFFSASWISKWLFSAVVLGSDVVWSDLVGAIINRSLGATQLAGGGQIFSAANKAFAATRKSVLIASVCIAAAALIRPILTRRLFSVDGAHWAYLHTPLIVPIAWAELLRNHTLVHPGFAARAFIFFAIIPLLASLWLNEQTSRFVWRT
jgi:hypothetical protein